MNKYQIYIKTVAKTNVQKRIDWKMYIWYKLKIEKSPYTLEKVYNWYDTKYVKVPDVEGLELKEAKKLLKDFTVNYSGNGNIVKSITPKENTILPINSTIKVLLSNWQSNVK